MGALVRLNRLDLAYNRLEDRLTENFGMLTGLTALNMSNNRISHLPPSLGCLGVSGQLFSV